MGRRHNVSNSDLLEFRSEVAFCLICRRAWHLWETMERRGEDSVLPTLETFTFKHFLESLQAGKKLILCHHLVISDSRIWSRSLKLGILRSPSIQLLEDPKLQFDSRSSSNGGNKSREWDIGANGSGWGIQVHGVPREARGGTRVVEGRSFPFGHHHRHSCGFCSPALRHGCLRLAGWYVPTTSTTTTTTNYSFNNFITNCTSLSQHSSQTDPYPLLSQTWFVHHCSCYFRGHQVSLQSCTSTIITFSLGSNKFLKMHKSLHSSCRFFYI